jgi:hypothetical protein
MNPDIHHDIGVQVSGFQHRNAVFMGYQPPYYARHLEAAGFRPLLDAHSWDISLESFLRDGHLRRLAERVESRGRLRIRSAEIGRFDQELGTIFHLYRDSFAGLWGFDPPTWEEFRFLASDLRYILRRNMVLIAEWDGEPVGFVVSVPDLYEILPAGSDGRLRPGLALRLLRGWGRVSRVRVMIAGVLPSHRRMAIHAPLFYRIASGNFQLGFRGGEISWVLEENDAMAEALPLIGARRTKTYRVYSMELS